MPCHHNQSQPPRVVPRVLRRHTWLWGAVGAYFLLLSYLLLTPHPLWFLGTAGGAAEEAVDQTLADYAQHALAYAVLGVLITLATVGKSHWQRCGWLAAAIAHGMICEALQHVIPHRYFGGHDALANAVGVIFGWGITVVLCRFPTVRGTVTVSDPKIVRD